MPTEPKHWAHAPAHLFVSGATYIVTSGTYQKEHFFHSPNRLDYLQQLLLETADKWGWVLDAWVIFTNHYHFLAKTDGDAASLKAFIRELHSKSAIWVNKQDNRQGRKVWYQYWDTCITYERSYLARLNYILQNPVKHGLVKNAEEYAWCSMRSFMHTAKPSFCKSVLSFKTDTVNVYDDFL